MTHETREQALRAIAEAMSRMTPDQLVTFRALVIATKYPRKASDAGQSKTQSATRRQKTNDQK